MRTSHSTVHALVLACLAVAAIGAGRPAGTTPAAAQPASPAGSATLSARWPLSAPASADIHPYDLAYLDDDTLLVTHPGAGEILALAGATSRATVWSADSLTDWYPVGIDHDPSGPRLIVGDRDPLRTGFLTLSGDGIAAGRVRLDTGRARVPEPAAIGPDGTIHVLVGFGAGLREPYQSVERFTADGGRLTGWPVHPALAPLSDPLPYNLGLAVDDRGRLYAATLVTGACGNAERFCPPVDRPKAAIYRFAPGGAYDGLFASVDDQRPWSGWHDEALRLAASPARGRLFVARQDPPRVEAYDTETGRSLFAVAPPQASPLDQVQALAARPDGGFALLLGFNDNPRLDQPPFGQVVAFLPDGTPYSRMVVRSTTDPAFWAAARLAADDTGRTHVLVPDAQVVLSLADDGRLERTEPAVSWPVDIAADAQGRVAVKGSSGTSGHLQLVRPDGREGWVAPCDCDATSAVAFHAGLIASAEALSGRVTSTDGWNGGGVLRQPFGSGDVFSPADLDEGPDGLYALEPVLQRAQVLDGSAAGREIAVGADATRIAVDADGRLAVLYLDGRIRVFAGGAATHVLRPAEVEGAAGAWPRDLAWGADGRLLVLDAAGPSVLALALGPAPTPDEPTPEPDEPVCRLTGDKTASPSRILLGEAVTVTLRLSAVCPPPPEDRVDLTLVLADLSYAAPDEERDHELAQAEMARRLVRGLDLRRVHVAVVQEGLGLRLGPSDSLEDIVAAIEGVGQRWPYQQPVDYADWFGFDAAAEQLTQGGRPGARKLILAALRRQTADYPYYAASADAARDRGVEVVVVNFGGPVGPELDAVAGGPDRVVDWRDAATTDVLFSRVGGPTSRRSEVGAVTVTDVLGADVRRVPGSTEPPAVEQSDRLSWTFDGLDPSGIVLSLEVVPQRAGIVPTNSEAHADYLDADGRVRRFVFPIPEVEVLAPTPTPTNTPTATATATSTATPTATATSTATPTATPTPRPAYLPLAVRERCEPAIRRIDAVLVLDASTSMRELTSAGRPKLEAAQEAARRFLDGLRLGAGDQVALVTFNSGASLARPLTGDRAAMEAALDTVQLAQLTRLDLGVRLAREELDGPRHDRANKPVMVVLTDGRANPVPADAAVYEAELAKGMGQVVFTVGVGNDLDNEALAMMASRLDYFHVTADGEGLAAILAAIAETIPCPSDAFWGGR